MKITIEGTCEGCGEYTVNDYDTDTYPRFTKLAAIDAIVNDSVICDSCVEDELWDSEPSGPEELIE